MNFNRYVVACVLCLMFFLPAMSVAETGSAGQPEAAVENSDGQMSVKPVPVLYNGRQVFEISASLGQFEPETRALAASRNLALVDPVLLGGRESWKIEERHGLVTVSVADTGILSLGPDDVPAGENPALAAESFIAAVMAQAARQPSAESDSVADNSFRAVINRLIMNNQNLVLNLVFSVAAFVLMLFLLVIISFVFRRLYAFADSLAQNDSLALSFRSVRIITPEAISNLVSGIMRVLRVALTLALFYAVIVFVVSRFPVLSGESIKHIAAGTLLTILTIFAAYGVFRLLRALHTLLRNALPGLRGTVIRPLHIKTVEILSEERIISLIIQALRVLYLGANILLLYIFIPIVFSFFEFTRNWADLLFGYVMRPLASVGRAVISYLPNLFFIVVIIVVNYYFIKLVRAIFDELQRGNFDLPGFHREWAMPTYKIVRFLIIVFTLIIVFPYLPGSGSDAFKGVSIFLGVLFSLGSGSVIANAVAGIILTYMFAFNQGDRVKIGETVGDVVEKTLLVTRVRTVKNVIVTIPNSAILGNHIINYSTSAREGGLILHTTVTIGYDVPWPQVHAALLEAARRSEHVLQEPKPFVLQTSLEDFYVAYELNVYTDSPQIMARIYSDLHSNIQNSFAEAGIEIMSPHYGAVRDGSQSTIPAEHLPAGYSAPPFFVSLIDRIQGKKE